MYITLASVVVALAATVPAAVSAFKIPTCGASACLPDGVFNTCEPADLGCLCSQDQSSIDEYVGLVTPCLESEERKWACTEGALYQYKDLLVHVCKGMGKAVVW
ncbi:hypothetical protein K505DRAFT_328388 [Melanomma pulvis-pyrius CBS 109.77]|uniref:Extracellular membrane protein CFEM domain-containing protein n=1 Tax=Melanomma pulvis-pyrius CBS 109.77 TaxID=1314802 RepID=A0A6A6WZ79_9PLEO|nr:hypothetical protein K505DRAFT_328388 [Melanomma pulvis-pyrius CBS 109.77]